MNTVAFSVCALGIVVVIIDSHHTVVETRKTNVREQ